MANHQKQRYKNIQSETWRNKTRSWNHYAPLTALTFNLTFDLEGWPWPWQATHQNVHVNEMHTHAIYYVAVCNRWKVMANVLNFNLTYDLEGWPWPWHATHKKVCINEMHKYVKYQVAMCDRWKVMAMLKLHIFYLQFDLWPWRMTLTFICYPSKCASWCDVYTCQISSCYLQ